MRRVQLVMLVSTRAAPEAAFELCSRIFGSSSLTESRSVRSLVICWEAFSARSPSLPSSRLRSASISSSFAEAAARRWRASGSSASSAVTSSRAATAASHSELLWARSVSSREARTAKNAARAAEPSRATSRTTVMGFPSSSNLRR